jgi:hypothetical protein
MAHANDNLTEGAMSNDERTTNDEPYKHLRIVHEGYRHVKRKERSQLLDHMERAV